MRKQKELKKQGEIYRAIYHPFNILIAVLGVFLSGCAMPGSAVRPDTYDFGLSPELVSDSQQTMKPVKTKLLLAVADVQAPRRLETLLVHYRLSYADAQATKPYANSRWSMPPAQLVAQRLRNRLAQDANVLPVNEVAADLLLRVELETFDQIFDAPNSSKGVVRLRASLIRDRHLIAQQAFSSEQPANSADAAGGVRALTQATDMALNAVAEWVKVYNSNL
jgi:cholesterol transport system auxiliary component